MYGTTSVTIVVAPGKRISATTIQGSAHNEPSQPQSKEDEPDDQLISVGGREIFQPTIEPKGAEEQLPSHADVMPGEETQTAHATVRRLGKYYWWQ